MVPAATNLSLSEVSPGYVQLSFDWAGHTNNSSFLIEFSLNSMAGFTQVAVTPPGGTTAAGTYTYTHFQGLSIVGYYRVRVSDNVDQTPSTYTSVVSILTQGNTTSTKLKFSACIGVCCNKIIFRDLTGLAPNPSTGYAAGIIQSLMATLTMKDISGNTIASWVVLPSTSPANFQELDLSSSDGLYQLEFAVTDGLGINLLAKEFFLVTCAIKEKIKCIVPGFIEGYESKKAALEVVAPMLYGVLPSQVSNGDWPEANRTITFINRKLNCAC